MLKKHLFLSILEKIALLIFLIIIIFYIVCRLYNITLILFIQDLLKIKIFCNIINVCTVTVIYN